MKKINLSENEIKKLETYLYMKTSGFNIYKLPNNTIYKLNSKYQTLSPGSTSFQRIVEVFEKNDSNLHSIDYPTGVVYYNGIEIGYESIFHSEYDKFDIENKSLLEVYEFQIKILDILELLANNGILYFDTNYENFLVSKNKDVKLIDFDPICIETDVNKTENSSKFIMFIKFNLNLMYILNSNLEIKIEGNTINEIRNCIQNNMRGLEDYRVSKTR